MFKKSLALRILALNLLLIVLPVTLYFLFLSSWEYEDKILTEISRLRNITQLRASYLDQFLQDQQRLVDLIEELTNLDRPESMDHFNELVKPLDLSRINREVGFFKRLENGHFVVQLSSNPKEEGRDLTNRGYLQKTFNQGRSVYLAYDDITEVPEFIISKTINSLENFQFLGILATYFPAEVILKTLTDDQYFAGEETISLLTEDRIVFASSHPDFLFTALFPLTEKQIETLKDNKQFGPHKIPRRVLSALPYSDLENVFQWTENGKKHIAFMAPVAGGSLYVLKDVEKSTILAPYIRATLITMAVLLIITLISCSITVLLSQLLSKTFKDLIVVMDKVGQEDLSARFQKHPFGFEINRAGETLNQMLDTLVEETKKAQNQRLKTETVSRELKIGREIQNSILPHDIPALPSLEIGVYSQSAAEVSGDFYDFYTLQDKMVITLSGTSGRGLFSCLYSVCLRSILRSFITKVDEPGEILEKTNALFHQDLRSTPLIVKTFTGSWNRKTATLSYASAGPTFGFVRAAAGPFESLSGSRSTMGSQPNATFPSYSLPLAPGSIVILYTSGIVDLQNSAGDFYGENKLKAFIDEKAFLGASELAALIAKELGEFSGKAAQSEDMTLIVLKVKGKLNLV